MYRQLMCRAGRSAKTCRVSGCLPCGGDRKTFEKMKGLRQLCRRTITGSARRQFENTVKEKQRMFQEDNGLPIHLKGGSRDALLYRATMTLTVFGSGYVVYELFSAAMPKKPH